MSADTAPHTTGTGRVRRRSPRLRTLVFGLLLALVSVSVFVSEAAGDRVDGAVLVIAALIGSGVILLVGAVGAAARGDDREADHPYAVQTHPDQLHTDQLHTERPDTSDDTGPD